MIVISVPSSHFNYIAAERAPVKRVLQNASRVANTTYALRVKIPTYSAPQARTANHHRRRLPGKAITPCLLRPYRPLSPQDPDIRKIAPCQELTLEVSL
jgi:hypothetical protein